MKNRNFIKSSIIGIIPFSLALGFLFGTAKPYVKQTNAYSRGSLPSTLDLNDTSDSDIRSYYSSLNSLTASEKKGTNLLKNLKGILKDGQVYYSYDTGKTDIWKMYEIIDRDWVKSPASEISGYNSSTNTVTGYTYSTTDPYVHALYVDRSVENQMTAWSNHQQTDWGINQEHIWAKSQGFEAEGAGGARGDVMHLWAGDGPTNNMHSNYSYGYVDKTQSYTTASPTYAKKNFKGVSKTLGSGTVFEPQDSDKGDIARALFYMVARYNNYDNENAVDSNNPNLELVNSICNVASYTSTASNTGKMGVLSDLLEWNELDPVDEFERHRNNLLFNNYTKNRNPFIDFPQWANIIWGSESGSANPSTDAINNGSSSNVPVLSGIEVTTNPTKLVYNVGESFDPSGMVVKANYSNGTSTTLTSSDYTYSPNTALTSSDTTVTISYQGETDTVNIAVQGNQSSTETTVTKSITDLATQNNWATSSTGDVTTYTSFSLDSVITVSTSGEPNCGSVWGSTTKDWRLYQAKNGDITISSSAGKIIKSVKITYGVSNTGVLLNNSTQVTSGTSVNVNSNSITFTVGNTGTSTTGQVKITSISVAYEGSSNVAVTGITLNNSSLTMDIGNNSSLTATIAPSNATIQLVSWTSSDTSVATVNEGVVTAVAPGSATITCSAMDASGVTATCSVTVNQPITLSSISLSGDYPTDFNVNDEFSSSGMIVTAHYSDSSTEDVTDDVEFSGYDMTETGEQTVTVSYDGVTTTYTITVSSSSLADNEILFVASQLGTENGEVLTTYTSSIATLSFNKETGYDPKYYSSKQAMRLYAKNSFTITGTKKIIRIDLTFADTYSNTITASTGSYSSGVWTGNNNVITFTVGGTTGQRNISSIKVTYDASSADFAPLSSIILSGTYKTQFFRNDPFTYEGLIVTAVYTNNTQTVVTPTSVSSPTMSTAGTKTITVSYTEEGVTRTATYIISVTNPVISTITLNGNYPTEFTQGDEFSYSGMSITANWNDGTTSNHLASSCTFTGYDMNVAGTQTVTVTYNEVSTTYQITVKESSIKTYVATITPNDFVTTSYAANDGSHTVSAVNSFNSSDTINFTFVTSNVMKETAGPSIQFKKSYGYLYNTGEVGSITSVEVNTLSGSYTTSYGSSALDSRQTSASGTTPAKYFNISATSTDTLKVSSIRVTFKVDTSRVLDSIAVSGDYKTNFTVGDDFTFGGTVTATYSDETTADVTSEATFSGYDLSNAGNQTVTVSYIEDGETKTTTYPITVSAPIDYGDEGAYSLVTNPSDLRTGDQVIIVGTRTISDVLTYFTMKSILSNVMTTTTLTMSSGSLQINQDTMTFTIEKSSAGYRFRNSDNEYLSTASSSNNYCGLETGTPSIKSLFNVTYEKDEMSVIGVDGDVAYTRRTLQYNYNTTGTPRFAFYATASVSPISIYKKVTQVSADAWAQTFLDSTTDCSVSNWDSLSSSYLELPSSVKSEISGVDANSSSDYSLRAQAMARYDYMLSRGDISNENNFISERGVATSRPMVVGAIVADNKNIQIIVFISLISISSIGCYLLIKRKQIREC